MELSPVYDNPSFLQIEVPVDDPAGLVVGQRRRLEALLAGLDERQWSLPSRCAGWSVRDVVTHLVSTNQFWTFSIGAAMSGEPSRFLVGFDPVATPADLVRGAGSLSRDEVLERFVASNHALEQAVAPLGPDDWDRPGEAPPGHVSLLAVALHALWDSWIHERDIVLPLGLEQASVDGEVAACLAYAAALGPMFEVAQGSARPGAIRVEARDPDVDLVVEVGTSVVVRSGAAPSPALHLEGGAATLVDGLSRRQPLPCPVPDEHQWLLRGVALAFDQAP